AANLRTSPVMIGGGSELRVAFSHIVRRRDLPVLVQGFFGLYGTELVESANRHRMGYMSSDRSAVAEGGLASVAANYPVLYEHTATFVDKILKGANPASLPVEQPSKFQMTINNKTAQELGLSISPTLLAQVDEVLD